MTMKSTDTLDRTSQWTHTSPERYRTMKIGTCSSRSDKWIIRRGSQRRPVWACHKMTVRKMGTAHSIGGVVAMQGLLTYPKLMQTNELIAKTGLICSWRLGGLRKAGLKNLVCSKPKLGVWRRVAHAVIRTPSIWASRVSKWTTHIRQILMHSAMTLR